MAWRVKGILINSRNLRDVMQGVRATDGGESTLMPGLLMSASNGGNRNSSYSKTAAPYNTLVVQFEECPTASANRCANVMKHAVYIQMSPVHTSKQRLLHSCTVFQTVVVVDVVDVCPFGMKLLMSCLVCTYTNHFMCRESLLFMEAVIM